MKQSTAVSHLRVFMFALQRYRSITAEAVGPSSGELHLSPATAAKLWPWAFGDKCPLPALSQVLGVVDGGGGLAPSDYYNLMTVLHQFLPELKAGIALAGYGRVKMPDEPPPIEILAGWEEE